MKSIDRELVYLEEIGTKYPSTDAALVEIARLKASLALPTETTHVISDVHGEFKKLRHVIANASGSLRMLVDAHFSDSLSSEQREELLMLIYYPREAYRRYIVEDLSQRSQQVINWLEHMLVLLRSLIRDQKLERLDEVIPEQFRPIVNELLLRDERSAVEAYLSELVQAYAEKEQKIDLIRTFARVVRNASVVELIVAGDLGDRGPRMDLVLNYLMRQPNVRFTWGNHDGHWMGACLGHQASVASVLRVCLRYGATLQLEEGYGIPLAPLERLALNAYDNDPAERFCGKKKTMRDELLLARMQKAIAIIQFKLESQVIERNKQFGIDNRRLLHKLDTQAGKIDLDGKSYPIEDTYFPTIDASAPYALSTEEVECIATLTQSFTQSPLLWAHMKFLAERGAMHLVRDNNLIFHACVPCDQEGVFLDFEVDGQRYAGRALFEKLHSVVLRAFRNPKENDLDLIWYLWSGPKSPWFGKDKMATLENYLIDDPAAHKEEKNPYFSLLHDVAFCKSILKEFDVDTENGLIVNGHVPVKIEKGESPLKKSGLAVTIDGAFSEAYGDKGYTLILDQHGTFLAQHHHFESVESAISQGTDIVPKIQELRKHSPVRTLGDTEIGAHIQQKIAILHALIEAYENNAIAQS